MKKLLLGLSLWLVAPLVFGAATLQVITTNFTTVALTGKVTLVNNASGAFATATATDNTAWFSNVVAGNYQLVLERSPTYLGNMAYTIGVTTTDEILSAYNLLGVVVGGGGTVYGIQTNIHWKAVTNLQSAQVPFTVLTNAMYLTNWKNFQTNVFDGKYQLASANLSNATTVFQLASSTLSNATTVFQLANANLSNAVSVFALASENLTNWSTLATNVFDGKYQLADANLSNATTVFVLTSENLTNWSSLATNVFDGKYQLADGNLSNATTVFVLTSENLTNWSSLATNVFDGKYQLADGSLSNATTVFVLTSENLTNWSSLATNVFDVKYQVADAGLSNLVAATRYTGSLTVVTNDTNTATLMFSDGVITNITAP